MNSWKTDPVRTAATRLGDGFERAGDWLRRAEGWQLALAAVAMLVILPTLPALVVIALLVALVLFLKAWIQEFSFLMRLDDEAFSGRNDKLIWAIAMIVLPPLGVWLFRKHREACWPEVKTAHRQPHEFD